MHKDAAEQLLAHKGLNGLSVDAQVIAHSLLAVLEQLEELSCVVVSVSGDDDEGDD